MIINNCETMLISINHALICPSKTSEDFLFNKLNVRKVRNRMKRKKSKKQSPMDGVNGERSNEYFGIVS